MTGLALAGGAAGIGGGATAATTGLLAGSTVASAGFADLGLIGAAMSAYGQYQQGKAQSDMFKYQAGLAQQENDLREDDRLRQAKRLSSAQTAQFGALGVELAGGSAYDAIARTTYDAHLDIFNDDFNTRNEIAALNTSARSAKQQGKNAAAGTLLNFAYKAGSQIAGMA